MVRTVRVRLELDRNDYRQGLRDAAGDTRGFDAEVKSTGKDLGAMGVEAKASTREVEAMGREVDAVAKTTKALGDETEKTKRKTTDLGGETEKTRTKIVDLTRDIDAAKASLKAMGDEFRKTGQIDLSKFNEASRALRELEKAKADLDKLTSGNSSDKNGGLFASLFRGIPNSEIKAAGMEAGKTFTAGVQGSLSTPILGPVLIGTLMATAIAVAPFIGAAFSGVGLGGAGLGAIAAGIISQYDDPRVKGAVVDLGTYFKAQLSEATTGFVGPFTSGIAALKREAAPLWEDLQGGFRALEPYVGNLLAKLGEGLAKLGPGLGRAMEAAGPIIGAVAKNIPTVLNGVNIFFDEISKGGKGSAEAIDALMKAISLAIAAMGFMLRGLADAYDFMVQKSDKLVGLLSKTAEALAPFSPAVAAMAEPLKKLSDYTHGVATSFDESKLAAGGASGALDLFTGSAGAADTAAGGLSGALGSASQSLQSIQSAMMSADQAAGQWRQGLLGLADGVKQHGVSLKENTTNGEANIQMLQDMVTKAANVRDANVANGQSIAYADQQYQQNIQTLIDNAVHLGFNRQQVQALIDKYKQVPGDVDTNVVLNGVVDAITKGQTLSTILNNLDGKVSRAAVITTYRTIMQEQRYPGIEQGTTSPMRGVVPNRWGGVYQHAAVGVLRDAAVYSAAAPARYAYAEPSTGGEAFVPKYGNYGRSMSILNHAASWYGARVMPAGAAGGSPTVINLNVNAGMGADGRQIGAVVVQAIKDYERTNGAHWRS